MIGPRPEVLEIMRRYRRQLDAMSPESTRRLLSIVERLETRIMESMRTYAQGGIDKRMASRVSAIANRISLEADPAVAAWFHREGSKAALNGTRMAAEYLARAASRGNTALVLDRVQQVYDAWQTGIDNGRLFNFTNETFAERAWQWREHWDATAQELQGKFVEAAARGDSWKELAKAITDDVGKLKLPRRINAASFSEAFTRTKLTEISNDASVAMSADLGLDKFYNLGVEDERQSDECAEADAMGSLTLAEWDASGVGRPPRHVFNCRCQLMADVSALEMEVAA